MAEGDSDDSASTLIRSGKSATTFMDMAAFVRDLEARPGPRLLEDLPGLLALPEAKYGLVVMVLRRMTKGQGPERGPILDRLVHLRGNAEDPLVRERCRLFLERPEQDR